MILIIEDDKRVGGYIREVLRLEGHDVELVQDGTLARDKVLSGAYDAVLCDVSLPGLDGPTLYQTLAQSRPEFLPRVAFMSGHDAPEVARRLGAPSLRTLKKPFGIDELRRFVAELLRPA